MRRRLAFPTRSRDALPRCRDQRVLGVEERRGAATSSRPTSRQRSARPPGPASPRSQRAAAPGGRKQLARDGFELAKRCLGSRAHGLGGGDDLSTETAAPSTSSSSAVCSSPARSVRARARSGGLRGEAIVFTYHRRHHHAAEADGHPRRRRRNWWWIPNAQGLRRMIESAGWDVLEVTSPIFAPSGPGYQRPPLRESARTASSACSPRWELLSRHPSATADHLAELVLDDGGQAGCASSVALCGPRPSRARGARCPRGAPARARGPRALATLALHGLPRPRRPRPRRGRRPRRSRAPAAASPSGWRRRGRGPRARPSRAAPPRSRRRSAGLGPDDVARLLAAERPLALARASAATCRSPTAVVATSMPASAIAW